MGDAKALKDIIQLKSRNLTEANKDGWIPLHETAYYGHVECLKLLLRGKNQSEIIPIVCCRMSISDRFVFAFH